MDCSLSQLLPNSQLPTENSEEALIDTYKGVSTPVICRPRNVSQAAAWSLHNTEEA
jgi:hypothetical protein